MRAASDTSVDLAAGDRAAGTTSMTLAASYGASPGYTAETSTLRMIQAFLYAISALVVGAFFTVLTIQRRPEIAVLRAIGASTAYLLRDSILQALVLLSGSAAVGVALGVAAGAALETTPMPFALEVAPSQARQRCSSPRCRRSRHRRPSHHPRRPAHHPGRQPMTTVLSLSDVTLHHRDGEETVTALDAVSLDVAAGELLAIVGASGSGKSSLLAVAGALITPTAGTVRLFEVDLTACTPRQRTAVRRERIGFVFQADNLVPALTSLDQLRLPLTFGRVFDPRDPHELLAAVNMEHKPDRRPHQLSGGERQRVGIARALMTRPDLLLVDEPTAALDRQRSDDVVAILARGAHVRGVAAVMVTHDQDVLHHCDRVLEMVDGRLQGAPST